MSQRRTLILIAAIAIGALASFLVWNYVGGIQDQAYNDAERVKVYLVKAPIAKGTSGNVAQASIVEESIPRKFRPANAIVSLDDIAGRVAKGDLVANQVVVADMFVEATDPEAVQSFTENIEKIKNKDMTTFTLSLDETHGVAGLIVAGDYVNIMYVEPSSGGTADSADGTSSSGSAAPADDNAKNLGQAFNYGQARYIYQKVQVLAIDYLTVGSSTAAAEGGDAAAAPASVRSGLVTLIVPTEAAQLLASLPPQALYFTLVSPDYKPTEQGTIDLTTPPAEDPKELTPYGPDGARKSAN